MNVEKTIKSLEERGFKVSFFETGDEAADYIASNVSGKRVGIGGCMTAKQIGLGEKLKANNEVFWHWEVPGRETQDNQVLSEVFISSANAISEDGEIVNIDGNGNRIASIAYGNGKKVYIVAGVNKIAEDFDKAIFRARNVAAVTNVNRFPVGTPCKADGKCHDCKGKGRICRGLLVLWAPMGNTETEVVLINGEYGY